MIHAIMKRIYQNDNGTGSVITFKKDGEQPLELYVIERPWKENQRNISCIPTGAYSVKKRDGTNPDLRFPVAWEIQDVPNRSAILFHEANFPDEVHGCLAPNLELGLKEFGEIRGYKSRLALQKMKLYLQGETEFILKIS